jgi:putative cell wall-binding protein
VTTQGDGSIPTTRWAGQNRWNTAELIATPTGTYTPGFNTQTVVLARGDIFPDALAGSFLAGGFNSPLLLTAPTGLPTQARRVLTAVSPERVIVLGGETAIGAGVLSDISTLDPSIFIERVSGAERYDTATRIARLGHFNRGIEMLPDAGGSTDARRTAFLARGDLPSDALVAGAAAAAEAFPLLLTASGSLPTVTRDTLAALDIERVIIVGGTTAISSAVETAVQAVNAIETERIAGADRVATAVAFAQFTTSRLGWAADAPSLASSADAAFADSLSLGPYAGLNTSPILLTSGTSLSSAVDAYLRTRNDLISLQVAGGTVAVSNAVVTAARTAASAAASTADVTPESNTVLAGETATVIAFTANAFGGARPESATVTFATSGGSPSPAAGAASGSTGTDGRLSYSFTNAGAATIAVGATLDATGESSTATVNVVAMPANWEYETATVNLTGSAEAPGPGDTNGTGTGSVRIDTDTGLICVAFTGLANIGLPATAAHIHQGAAGSPGNVVVPLVAPDESGSSNGCVVNSAQATAIDAAPAQFYLNVHNGEFADGAIRGQLG